MPPPTGHSSSPSVRGNSCRGETQSVQLRLRGSVRLGGCEEDYGESIRPSSDLD
ncbi:Hypothetical protein SMAX5B_001703 [Scophthalmus maximus]|uniref:Uncharacterized protein n=1 Tax=Scophthalmus maximus TaxID=52904 RepID=A0A2U9CZ53_SCOMX|nr:Hypothetical protein SMAX5B_001703 [Scophthalmus maximus]